MRSIIIDDVGEQADNGQHAENDFSYVHEITFFPQYAYSSSPVISWSKVGSYSISSISSSEQP